MPAAGGSEGAIAKMDGAVAAVAANADEEGAKSWRHMTAAALASGCVAWRKRRLTFCGEERRDGEWFCTFHCYELAGRVSPSPLHTF